MSSSFDVWLLSSRLAFLTSRSIFQCQLGNAKYRKISTGSALEVKLSVVCLILCDCVPKQPDNVRAGEAREANRSLWALQQHNGVDNFDAPISASWSFSPAASSSSCDILAAISFEASFGSVVFFIFPFFDAFDSPGLGAVEWSCTWL